MDNKHVNLRKQILKYHHIHGRIFPFRYADSSDDEEYKEELIGVESIAMRFSDINGYGYVERVDFFHI